MIKKLKILNKILIFIIFISLISCETKNAKEIHFDKVKWNEKIDGFYIYRKNMIKDLMKNHLNKGQKMKTIIEMLGKPDNYQNKKNNEMVYEIMVDYGFDIDPMESKKLIIEFDNDSLLTEYKLKHWKN